MVLVTITVLVIFIGFGAYYFLVKRDYDQRCSAVMVQYPNLPKLTAQDLTLHDGVKRPDIYLAYKCIIYDVTAGKDKFYGLGKPYHYLVGRDSTKQLMIFGGDTIAAKYPAVGVLNE